MRLPGFIGPTYQDGALREVCLNLIPERVETGSVENPYAKAQFKFRPTPSLVPLVEIEGASSIVAMRETLGRLFIVARAGQVDTLYEITRSGTGPNANYAAVRRADIPGTAHGAVGIETMGDTGRLLMVYSRDLIHYLDLAPKPNIAAADDPTRGPEWARLTLSGGRLEEGGGLVLVAQRQDVAAAMGMTAHAGPAGGVRLPFTWIPPDGMTGFWIVPFVDGVERLGRQLLMLGTPRDVYISFHNQANPIVFEGCVVRMRVNEVGKYLEMSVYPWPNVPVPVGSPIPVEASLRIYPAFVGTDAPTAPIDVGDTLWYPNVECFAQFAAEIDGFFVRLDSTSNEIAVSPHLGVNAGLEASPVTVSWEWDSLPEKTFRVDASDLQCIVGDATRNRLWYGRREANALVAVVLETTDAEVKGRLVPADDIAIPAAMTSPPTGGAFYGGKLYLVNATDTRVFVLNAAGNRIEGDEFEFEYPDAPNTFTPWSTVTVDVYVRDGYLYLLFEQHLGANLAEVRATGTVEVAVTLQGYTLTGARWSTADINLNQFRAAGITGPRVRLTGADDVLLVADRTAQRIETFNAETGDRLVNLGSSFARWRSGLAGVQDSLVWYDATPTPERRGDSLGRVWIIGSLRGVNFVDVSDLHTGACGRWTQFRWDPLQSLQRTTHPDQWVAMAKLRKELFVFGTTTGDVLRISPTRFPLAVRTDVFIHAGVFAPRTLIECNKTLMFVGATEEGAGYVYQLDGYDPQRISTHAVEKAIRAAGMDALQDAVAWAYELEGHAYYVLRVPGLDETWVFDASTGVWHTRASGADDDALEAWRAATHAVAWGLNIVGDAQSGKLAALEDAKPFEDFDGRPVFRRREVMFIQREKDWANFVNLRLDVEVDALESGATADIDPAVEISWTKNQGRKYSRPAVRRLGMVGDYRKDARVDDCGNARQIGFRFDVRTRARVGYLGAFVDVV